MIGLDLNKMPNYAILNQVHVNKVNVTETIKIYHQQKNI